MKETFSTQIVTSFNQKKLLHKWKKEAQNSHVKQQVKNNLQPKL